MDAGTKNKDTETYVKNHNKENVEKDNQKETYYRWQK